MGDILSAIGESGLAAETLVIFASDNGGVTYLGVTDNGHRAGGKFTTFQGGLEVPMMIRYPGVIDPGSLYDQPVSLLDLFATIERATGSEQLHLPDREYDGIDLLPLVTGESVEAPRRALYWRSDYNRAIRVGDWKLIEDTKREVTRLYNLAEDASERENMSDLNPSRVAELSSMLDAWEAELEPPAWPGVMEFFIDVWGERFWFSI